MTIITMDLDQVSEQVSEQVLDHINERLILVITENKDEPLVYIHCKHRYSTTVDYFNEDYQNICKKNNLLEEDATRIVLAENGRNDNTYLGFYIGKVDLGLNKESKNELSLSYIDYKTSMHIYYGLKSVAANVSKFKIVIFDQIYNFNVQNTVKNEIDKTKYLKIDINPDMIICTRVLPVNCKIADRSPDNVLRSYEKVIDIDSDTTWKEMIKLEQRLIDENGIKVRVEEKK